MKFLKQPALLTLFCFGMSLVTTMSYCAESNTSASTSGFDSSSSSSSSSNSDADSSAGLNTETAIHFTDLANIDLGRYLGWQANPEADNLCAGYFIDLPIDYPMTVPTDTDPNMAPIKISAGQGDIKLTGKSQLSDGVQITQVQREISANQAEAIRNDDGELTQITLHGQVHFRRPQQLIVADRAIVPFKNGQIHDVELHDVAYRLSLSDIKPVASNDQTTSATSGLTAWGKAKQIKEDSPKQLSLTEASYSTCAPDAGSCAWHISAHKLHLDKATGRGQAYLSTLWLKQVPVLFLPYFSFPIDNQRKSGFLYPDFTESSDNGFSITLPYYANLAPNYDLTLAPTFYDQRGFFLGSQWRYLTQASNGFFNLGIAPDDQKFADFQQSATTDYAGSPELGDLEDASTTRIGLHWLDNTNFNNNWSGYVDYSYVSDDYYTQDFSTSLNTISDYQLVQMGQVNYYGTHWTFSGLLKNYQTLHPIDQDTINNQYARLPELNFNGNYPDQLPNTDLTLQSQFDYFYEQADPGETTDPVIGGRVNVQPGLSLPFRASYGYVTPSLQVSATGYQLQNETAGSENNPSRVLPLLDLDTGLYFDRDVTLFQHQYSQTFEPRVYYLYVPYTDQDDLPDFDSVLNTLNYDQLFRDNRFSSVDRIGDANQFSFGATSRFFDQVSGEEKVRISMGSIWYLRDREVSLCSDDSSDCAAQNTETFAPVVSTVNYQLAQHWSIDTDTSYDFDQGNLDNSAVTIAYAKDRHRVVNFGYAYSSQGNIYVDSTDDSNLYNLSQLHASYAWPLNEQWNTLGSIDFSPSYGNGISYLAGVEYSTCCWGIKLFVSKQLTGVENGDNQYDNAYYLQFVLKGMGSFNSRNAAGVIKDNIDHYQDDFVRVF